MDNSSETEKPKHPEYESLEIRGISSTATGMLSAFILFGVFNHPSLVNSKEGVNLVTCALIAETTVSLYNAYRIAKKMENFDQNYWKDKLKYAEKELAVPIHRDKDKFVNQYINSRNTDIPNTDTE